MFVALSLTMLVALVGLGSLAAIVFGIVYGITHKRPGVALASVMVPIVGFFGVTLVAMTIWGARSLGHLEGPVHPNWTAVPPLAALPSMPPMPGMPAMPPVPAMGPLSMNGDVELASWAKIALVGLAGLALVGFCIKGPRCSGKPRLGSKVAVMAAMALAVMFAIRSARESSNHVSAQAEAVTAAKRAAEAQRAIEVRIQDEHEAAHRKLLEAQRLQEEANDRAAEAMIEGSTFQQLLEKLNRPRIKLENDGHGASVSFGTGVTQVSMQTTDDGESDGGNSGATLVMPISEETQESLARSVERLEAMVEQVSDVADQVSDAGTLLGKAMVALNDRIDTRKNGAVAPPAPPQPVAEAAPPATPAIEAKHVASAESTATSESQQHVVTEAKLELPVPTTSTIEVFVDPGKLTQFGLTFEKLKEALSREGLWRGTVVRFDAHALQISTTGQFEDGYISKLLNTLVFTYGRNRVPVHLSDVAEVKARGTGAEAEIAVANVSRPDWVGELPRNVGDTWREVVTTEEYSTPEECVRAADVYLLLKTYNNVMVLLGDPRSDAQLPTLAFREDGTIAADGEVIYEKHGSYGSWRDPRFQKLQDMGVDIDFVRSELVPPDGEYYETIERSFGPMKKLYTRLELRPNVKEELRRRWDELRRGERFAVVGAGAGSVLGLLGFTLGLLKVDTWTKGYYTKRLFLGVPAAIIGVLALLGLAAG